ncbi:MAG: hypothetical protein EOP46_02930 [Sphingobacteriaceae bacterium]|nr:MAG: hypothetical protein EOP46_02930 [Sphingobacteriaceae bacterium]
MNVTGKFSFATISCLLIAAMISPVNISMAADSAANLSDSTSRKQINHKPKIREVLTSQQLFVVTATAAKGKDAAKLFDLKGELRDAFMIIGYLDNGSVEELNWTMCPDGKCPETGTFKAGTKEYVQLDSLIAKFKPQSQPE